VELAEARRAAAESAVKAQTEERQRIARELHDATAQSIAAISIGVAALKSADSADARDKVISDLERLASEAGQQIRIYSHTLHSPELEKLGLQAALQEYIAGLCHRTGLSISLDWRVRDRSRMARYNPAMLRIAQEALWNVYRHSGAANASVAIIQTIDAVSLTICDSGNGIDLTKAHVGLGLASMRERTEELGGTMTVDSSDKGTCITARFPAASTDRPTP
jgi:signal transduction histidine kinase